MLNKNKLKKIIRESIRDGYLGGNKPIPPQSNEDKIKAQLKSFDRSFIIQTYALCESIPELDFQQIVRGMVDEMLETSHYPDSIHQAVSNMLEILHYDKLDVFYIEDENIEGDVQQEFAYKTISDIMENLKDYYVNYFVAIGKGL